MAAKKAKKAAKKSGGAQGKVISSKVVYQGPVFSVRRDVVSEPSGVKAARDVISHSGSVVVMPVLSDGRIVLIRQYRHAAGQYLWELVAGRIDPGEKIKQAAARELVEETGLRAKKMRLFLDFWPSPGFLEERMFVLLAEGVTQGEAEPEQDERIEAQAFGQRELEKMLRTGVLRDAKTISSLLFYFRFMV
ncbi:MAG TPA: NUDIX hydrolase [Candidatus Sulfotelmatobacter sp.]|nr:NUDIX hydrolase [Candidatus Sulfotelmatobacter sp.]